VAVPEGRVHAHEDRRGPEGDGVLVEAKVERVGPVRVDRVAHQREPRAPRREPRRARDDERHRSWC